MPANDERHEVAARLREQKTWDICTEYEYCIGDICDAVFEDDGNLNDMFRLQTKLADLIEPEPEHTCEGHRCEETGEWVCHKCGGSLAGYMFDPVRDGFVCVPNFCPSCGEKVVDHER